MDCLNNSKIPWSRIANMYSRISVCIGKFLQFSYPMYLHYKLCISVYKHHHIPGTVYMCAIFSFSIFKLLPLSEIHPQLLLSGQTLKTKICPVWNSPIDDEREIKGGKYFHVQWTQ